MEYLKGRVGPLRQLYHKWRALRSVPFRKKFFVGYDLDGNTFWEFHDPNNPLRMRRIVEYRIKGLNWVDYKLSPQWMQWLRNARPHHPTLQELVADKHRQAALKGLVEQAEERWRSVPIKSQNSDLQIKPTIPEMSTNTKNTVKSAHFASSDDVSRMEVKNLKPRR